MFSSLEIRLRDIQSQIDERQQMIDDLNEGSYDNIYSSVDIYHLMLGLRSEIEEFTNVAMSLETQLVALRSMANLGEIDGISFYIKPERGTKHKSWQIHCRYAGYELSLGIDGNYLAGEMPHKQLAKAVKWVLEHRALIDKQIKKFDEQNP